MRIRFPGFDRLTSRYLGGNLLIATVFITGVLSAVILLTQSLRFLDLVVSSGASALSFYTMTILVLPRFLEVILPLALTGAVLFSYQKLQMDSELVVLKATGFSPYQLARPALFLSAFCLVVVFVVSAWIAPLSLSKMQNMRGFLKTQVSTLFLREGVFNRVGDDLMVYVRGREPNGEFRGILIHDNRDPSAGPVTVLAKRGVVVSTPNGYQVLVYEGVRQSYDKDGGTGLSRLIFERYSIDLPAEEKERAVRWTEPEERTLEQLFHPDANEPKDVANARDFVIEIHKRVTSPFLAPAFTLIALCFMLLGQYSRHGLTGRMLMAVSVVVILQGLYLSSLSLARDGDLGLIMLYCIPLIPIIIGSMLILGRSVGAPNIEHTHIEYAEEVSQHDEK